MEEITAEYSVVELVPPPAVNFIAKVTVACKSDLGRVRENNEDKFEYFLTEDPKELATRGQTFLVCDGMGGHNAGQIASELACKTYFESYLNHPSFDPEIASKSAFEAANRFVHQIGLSIPSRRGMGTTMSVLSLVNDRAIVSQVGDSRVYRIRNHHIEQLSPEHTYIEEMVSAGLLSRAAAEVHPNRHMITRAIGTEAEVRPDIINLPAEIGDIYLICSDGLTNHINDERILKICTELTPSAACQRLVGDALQDGGSDNCTVMIVRIDDFLRP